MLVEASSLKELLEANEQAREEGARYPKKRLAYKALEPGGRAFVAVAGLRGTGKTTALKQRLVETKNAFYVSLDHHPRLSLFKLAQELRQRYAVRELLLDEISYCRNWERDLKKIYDRLALKVIFTSSVAVDIVKAPQDLSRRVRLQPWHPFSFREFLLFHKNKHWEKMDLEEINDLEKMRHISRLDFLFEEYMEGGLLPASLEEKNPEVFQNILERVLERDLVYAFNFGGKDVLDMKALLEFTANAGVDDVSYSSLAQNIGVTKYRARRYVDALEKAFVLNVVKPFGSNVLKEPKILFTPPFRQGYVKNRGATKNIGALREEFFVESMKIAGHAFYYLKGKRGEKRPDYLVLGPEKKYVFEVGGPGKNRAQLSRARQQEKYLLTHPSSTQGPCRPLLFAGFL